MADGYSALLTDLLNPSITIPELCEIHRIPLDELDELDDLLASPQFSHALARMKRINATRRALVEDDAQTLATTRLADLLRDRPESPAHAETQRKAATTLLRQPNASPTNSCASPVLTGEVSASSRTEGVSCASPAPGGGGAEQREAEGVPPNPQSLIPNPFFPSASNPPSPSNPPPSQPVPIPSGTIKDTHAQGVSDMNTKAAAAILTVTAASGVLGAAWWLNTQNAPEPAPQPQPAPEPEPQPAALDMFSIPTTPSPAAVFFQSVNGTPIPARARREVNSWLSMMESLVDRMNEFDADGDGMLSDLEKIAMGYRLRKEFIADYDLDGDGEMSGAEWRAFQRGLFEQSAQGQLLMQQFDADADGVLNEEEQAAMDAHLEQQEEQRRAEDRARADTDGDGQLSEDERRAARQQERQFWQSQMTAAENNFDRDGDGELNIEESRDAWDAWVEYQTVDAFINDYDTDGDRAMGPADYDAFLSQYERRSRKADVNADGEINVQDINAFRDLVLRSRSM